MYIIEKINTSLVYIYVYISASINIPLTLMLIHTGIKNPPWDTI